MVKSVKKVKCRSCFKTLRLHKCTVQWGPFIDNVIEDVMAELEKNPICYFCCNAEYVLTELPW